MKRILITGCSGFIGHNIYKVLDIEKYKLFPVCSKDYDLLDFNQSDQMFKDIKPDVVIHLAAKSGGILDNKEFPAEFWFKNMTMTSHIWELSSRHKIEKLIYFLPGCCYPEFAECPMSETDLFNGFPDIIPASGALSKKQSILASYAYKKQHGLNSCILIPANLYGPHDHFHPLRSHVIGSLILKIHSAKEENKKEFLCWGNGSATRDFVYVEDVANMVEYFIENNPTFNGPEYLNNVCNLSSSTGCSIKELAETLVKIIGYNGKIVYDVDKPSGPAKKTFCNKRMKSLGLNCQTSLDKGLKITYDWYKSVFCL